MISGVRNSAAGMSQRATAQEVLTNNLANLGTPGFKGDRIEFVQLLERAMASTAGDSRAAATGGSLAAAVAASRGASGSPATAATRLGPGDAVAVTSIDLRPGPVQVTGNDFDFAVDGTGFFAVQTPQGERYTRGGAFTLDGEGKLVTRSGYPVLSDAGPVVVESGHLMVSEDGTISVNGETTGRLKVVSFAGGRDLRRSTAGLLEAVGTPQPDTESRVLQGSLEDSNVNPVEALTEMIMTMRQFEANAKALKEQSDSAEKLIADASK